MNAVVKLTGYDKVTELLTTEAALPKRLLPKVRAVAGVSASDPKVLAMYPLTPEQAAEIAAAANLPLEQDRFDYFLEAIADDRAARARNA